jgi:4,4'-diaponeurosporenoate glycosyltransferase
MFDLRMAVEGILCALGVFLVWGVLFQGRSQAKKDWGGARSSRISVVIPARNEENRIGKLLDSLKEQTVKPHEVIIVDDHSSDCTGAVALEKGMLVIESEPLPEDWNGKPWACWQGAKASTGDVLLFLDADTWAEPGGIERLLNLYEGCGLLTVQPYHVTKKPYEQLSAFFNIVTLASVGVFTPFGNYIQPGGAFGPCVMCSREAYFQTGGHREVRGETLEDIPLAKLFLRHDMPVRCYPGQGIISFRMYAEGLEQLVEGWTKGMGYGAFSVHPLFSLMLTAWITGCFGAFFQLITALSLSADTAHALAWIIVYISYAVTIWYMLKRIGQFKWWTSLLFPIPLLFFAAITANSMLQTFLLGRVVWKGRVIRTIDRRK